MQTSAREEIQRFYQSADGPLDNATANRIKKSVAADFRKQLIIGVPTARDEAALRRLAADLRSAVLQVKLFLRHPLHAKLYLCFRDDHNVPIVGFLGSSNLTFSGLSGQGELNVDVLDQDACRKLESWFVDRWDDRFALDISAELAEIIESSWARERPLLPAHIYYKIAYHLSQEARSGLSEFAIPSDMQERLLEHQTAAVKIAARYVNRRGGVLLGDVVGLGKTIMAIALARVFQDDPRERSTSLVICPKNLVAMWQQYFHEYAVAGTVLPLSRVAELEKLPRYQTVIIDESHNLRNRETKRYRAIKNYIARNNSRCILLSATPYNKGLLDLSSQLRLFVPPDKDLGVRPERMLREVGELQFAQSHQVALRTLAAFEKSQYPEDWRELMGLFMIRRTRSYVEQIYAEHDRASEREYLRFSDGTKFFFPKRVPITLPFEVNANDKGNIYARLQSVDTVNLITDLRLPRYGLGNYAKSTPEFEPTSQESEILKGLSRAGKRLIGFCKTGFFKRLESEAFSFITSIRRHIVRNSIFAYALKNALPLPIGIGAYSIEDHISSDPEEFDDLTLDLFADTDDAFESDEVDWDDPSDAMIEVVGRNAYTAIRAASRPSQRWIRAEFFTQSLLDDLSRDNKRLLKLLHSLPTWNADTDEKLIALEQLLRRRHPNDKVLVFTQYADTAVYLAEQLQRRGMESVVAVTSETENPTATANRFSPKSNGVKLPLNEQLRVLITTDVLSEGQNLQDCGIVVNFDLPWAIIRLIQRAGRIDRIGQSRAEVICYTFMPSDGVDRVIRLRQRLRQRLRENAEVVGTDERFFEEHEARLILNIYAERDGSLDDDDEGEVDLASYCLGIWKAALEKNPDLEKIIPELPNFSYSTAQINRELPSDRCAVVYSRTSDGVDSLSLIGRDGETITESPLHILQLAGLDETVPPARRFPEFFDMVRAAVEQTARQEVQTMGVLGRASTRSKLYDLLRRERDGRRDTLFANPKLEDVTEKVFISPLQETAEAALKRMLRAGTDGTTIAEQAIELDDRGELVLAARGTDQFVELICSLGLERSGESTTAD